MWKGYLLLFCSAFLVRFLWLENDPSIFLSYGQIGDEGLWVHNARLWVVFGARTIDEFSHDYAVSPLFSWMVEASFRLFGVHFWSARVPSALFGFGTFLLAFDLLRRVFFGRRLLLFTMMVGFHPLLLVHNRLAVPDSLAIFFLTASWWAFLTGIRQWHFLLGGILLGFSLLAKSTSIQFFPVFFLHVMFFWFILHRRREAFWFLLGVLVSTAASGIFWWTERTPLFAIYSTFARVYSWENSQGVVSIIRNLWLHPFWGSPFVIGFSWLFLRNTASFLNSVLVDGRKFLRKVDPIFVGALLWFIGGVATSFFGTNHPMTRFYPLLIPMIIFTGASMPLFPRAKNIFQSLVPLSIFFIALFVAKVILAIGRRTVFSSEIREMLYWPTALILTVVVVLLYRYTHFLKAFLRGIQPIFWRVFFGLTLMTILQQFIIDFLEISQHVSQLGIALFRLSINAGLVFILWKRPKSISPNRVYLSQCALSVVVIVLMFAFRSETISASSKQLGVFSKRGEYTTGFLAHELSLENTIYPIYWGPRQPFVGNFNEAYAQSLPTLLVVPTYLEGEVVASSAWPTISDFPNRNPEQVGQLMWFRRIGMVRREIRMSVFRIWGSIPSDSSVDQVGQEQNQSEPHAQ